MPPLALLLYHSTPQPKRFQLLLLLHIPFHCSVI